MAAAAASALGKDGGLYRAEFPLRLPQHVDVSLFERTLVWVETPLLSGSHWRLLSQRCSRLFACCGLPQWLTRAELVCAPGWMTGRRCC